MIKPYECTQCGSTDFDGDGTRRVRCAHCGSLFEVLTGEPTLSINKGAKVIFGKKANVEVRGDIDIQSGVNVDVQGKVVVVKGNRKQEFKLKLVQNGGEPPKTA